MIQRAGIPRLLCAILVTVVCLGVTPSWAADVKSCLGDLQSWLPPESIQPCLDVAKSDETKNETKSRIYLQLAVAQNFAGVMQGLTVEDARAKTFSFVYAAIAADPSYEDSYFFAARNYADLENVHSIARKYLDDGLSANPHSALLGAANAYYAVPDGEQARERVAQCDGAIAHAPHDKTVQTLCGKVYFVNGETRKALRAFRVATVGYRLDQRRIYGVMQYPNPWFSLAETYSRLGQSRMAVASLNQYWKSVPPNMHTADEYLILGDYLAEAGKFKQAADQYESAIKLGPMLPVSELKLRQLFYLSRSGDKNLAHQAADKMFANADKKTVLQLQVALKNATGSNDPVTGVFDENTKALLVSCLGSKKCQFSTERIHY